MSIEAHALAQSGNPQGSRGTGLPTDAEPAGGDRRRQPAIGRGREIRRHQDFDDADDVVDTPARGPSDTWSR